MNTIENNSSKISGDISVTILVEVVERNTRKSLVPPIEFTCEISRHQYDSRPDDVSDSFLSQMAVMQYSIEFKKIEWANKEFSNKLAKQTYHFDWVLLERRNITFGEIFEKLGIK